MAKALPSARLPPGEHFKFPFYHSIVLFCLFVCIATADNALLETQQGQQRDGDADSNRRHHADGPSTSEVKEKGEETFLIRQGRHPSISYPNLSKMNDTEIHIRWLKPAGNGKTLVVDADDCPRHFLWLSDQAIEAEFEYRLQPENTNQKWSDRVLVEKIYFTLFYGGTGLAAQYLDAADHFETDLRGWNIMDREPDKPVDANVHCSWEGLECNDMGELTAFRLEGFALEGTIPTDLQLLSKLEVISYAHNNLRGTIPSEFGTALTNLRLLNLVNNQLSGRLPATFSNMVQLEKVWLSGNKFRGPIGEKIFEKLTNLVVVDFSENSFRGSVPKSLTRSSKLKSIFLHGNQLSGSLPKFLPTSSLSLESLEVLDLGHNKLSGTIAESWFHLPNLIDLSLPDNQLTGTIPTQLMNLTSLQVLVLSNNKFFGTIPRGDDILPGDIRNLPGDVRPRNPPTPVGAKWGSLNKLRTLLLNDNQLTGQLETTMLFGLAPSLVEIDLANNRLSGQIPSLLGKMTKLERIDAQNNSFSGTLPSEMNRMFPDIQLNLTNNLLTGTVPKIFCGGGVMSPNILYRQFGCDAVLCPAGTFHPNGAASLFSGCRPCPVTPGEDEKRSKFLGRTTCNDVTFLHGDLNGDGIVSEREALRLLYTYTIGRNWGPQFDTWADPTVDKCDLNGITCVDGSVAKIDLTDAALCSNGERERNAAIVHECKGIPGEISTLSNLEVLVMSRRQFLRGTLPSEIGSLSKLRYIDMSNCPFMTGPVPSEIGKLTHLRFLSLSGCRFNSTLPEELFQLSNLDKLHLSTNAFTGTLSPSVGSLTSIKELGLSRSQFSGNLPSELGALTTLENIEMYGNKVSGTIPDLGKCTNLKRIDLFNNMLSGELPKSFAHLSSLQILHLKSNRLSGTIHSAFGRLPNLSWLDVSDNRLHGTISEAFGSSKSLRDFRLGGNMIHDPIPKTLCSNPNLNGGLTRQYGCSGVICPLGTYSEPGHATHSDGCKVCPDGQTTMYLGSTTCSTFTDKDILSILYAVMGHSSSARIQKAHWLDQNNNDDVCSWRGIHCDPDNNGTVEAITFPLYGLHDMESN